MRGSQSTQRDPTHAQGAPANPTQKEQRPEFQPLSFLVQCNTATNQQIVHINQVKHADFSIFFYTSFSSFFCYCLDGNDSLHNAFVYIKL